MASTQPPPDMHDDVEAFMRVIGSRNRLQLLQGLAAQTERVTLRELGADVGMVPSHARDLIDLLVETGVAREIDAGRDSQAEVAYEATAAGERVAAEIAQPVAQFIADEYEGEV